MTDLVILGIAIFILLGVATVASVSFACVLLKEADKVSRHANDVNTVFSSINIEIASKLKNNNAIAYVDLVSIVRRVANLFPGVNITLKKEFEIKQITIVIESGKFTANLSILATIVEYGYRPSTKETSEN